MIGDMFYFYTSNVLQISYRDPCQWSGQRMTLCIYTKVNLGLIPYIGYRLQGHVVQSPSAKDEGVICQIRRPYDYEIGFDDRTQPTTMPYLIAPAIYITKNPSPPPLRCVHSVAAFKRQLKTFLYNHALN